jgi:hypothetical protein
MLSVGLLSLSVALLTQPAIASASYDPVGTGTVKLTLAPAFQRLLASHGVKLLPLAPARATARSYNFPASGGRLDPSLGKGEIETLGALLFRRGRLGVRLRHLTVKTKRQPLIAKVGGGQLKLADAAKASFTRRGFGAAYCATGLRLTSKLATRLSKKLHLHGVFEVGQAIGTLRTATQPATTAVLPTGRAIFSPDPAFIAKLESLFVSLNPIAPAERQAGPTFTVPFIPAGTISPDGTSGVPRTGGSLEFLQLGGGQISWHEVWFDLGAHQALAEVDIEPTPSFPGKLGQIPIATLAPGVVSPDPQTRSVSLSGTALALNSQTAVAFNQAFAKPQGMEDVFRAGEAMGSLTFSVHTQ